MSVIDCHCHIYPEKIAPKAVESVGNFYGIPMDVKDGTCAGLLKACEGSPIKRFIVHSVATRPAQVESINDFIAKACKDHPEFTGFMTLHQDYPDPEREIERCEGLGLKGIKLHPDTQRVDLDDPRLMAIYEIAEGRLPLIIHTGDYRYDFSHPRRMKSVLHTFPGLVVDAAHFGGWSIFDLATEYLEDEHCYVDMSSAITLLGLRRSEELIHIYGIDRVMFGSDFPMWDPLSELSLLERMGFTDDEMERLTRLNAERFIAGKLPVA